MLHGREAEQSRLSLLLEDALAERGNALVLLGPAGVGKTALLTAARDLAADFQVLSAQGVEAESELPFAGLHQLLRPLLHLLPELPAPQAGALRVAFGLVQGDSENRFLVSVAALSLLAQAAEQGPVLCVVDDTHWLDEASANALVFVARRLQAERLALLFSAREGDVRQFSAPGLDQLRVSGLTVGDAIALLREQSGRDADRAVCEQLVEATGGNPLALHELARVLDAEALTGQVPLPRPLPLTEGVERAFLDRVRRLPPAAQTFLLVAAAEDTGRLSVVMAAAGDLDVDRVALRAAEQAGLIRVQRPYLSFTHPLVRSAIYQGATTADRQDVHRALAAVLVDPADADQRAWQRAAATSDPDDEVVTELSEAAGRARRRGAYDAACAALERAANLSASAEQRASLLAAAAENAWLSGQLQRAVGLVHTARPLTSDPLLRADVDRLLGSIEIGAGSVVTAKDILVAASNEVASIDPRRALTMLMLAAEAASYATDTGTGIDMGILAARIDPGPDRRNRLMAALLVAFGHYFAADLAVAMPALRGVIAEVDANLDDLSLLAAAGRATMYVGDDEAALRLHNRVVSTARAQGAIGDVLLSLQRIALVETLTGRWSAATASGAEVLRLARETGQHEIAALPAAHLTLIAAWRGDQEAFTSGVDRTRRILAGRPIELVQDELHWARGAFELTCGRPEQAAEELRAIRHPAIATLAWLDQVEALVQSGQADSARPMLDQLDAFAEHSGAAWAAARAAHCRGLLDGNPSAEEHFAQALEQHRAGHRLFERARTELAWGRTLRRARRRSEARPHLRAALTVFEDLNATPWAERARLELRASGETARSRDPSAVSTLTPQEMQVARFVARGLPTREVAAQLFLSPRTVDYHLRNVFSKVGVTSRTELAQLPLE